MLSKSEREAEIAIEELGLVSRLNVSEAEAEAQLSAAVVTVQRIYKGRLQRQRLRDAIINSTAASKLQKAWKRRVASADAAQVFSDSVILRDVKRLSFQEAGQMTQAQQRVLRKKGGLSGRKQKASHAREKASVLTVTPLATRAREMADRAASQVNLGVERMSSSVFGTDLVMSSSGPTLGERISSAIGSDLEEGARQLWSPRGRHADGSRVESAGNTRHLVDESFHHLRDMTLALWDWRQVVLQVRTTETRAAMAFDRDTSRWGGNLSKANARQWHEKTYARLRKQSVARKEARELERLMERTRRTSTDQRLEMEAKAREEKAQRRRLRRAAAAAERALERSENRLRQVRALRCWWATWDSPLFWRVLPWCISVPLMSWLAFDTMLTCLVLTDLSPDPIKTNGQFFQNVAMALAIGWFIQDPIVILVRNNIKCTASIVRTKRYQTIEKFVVGPIATVAKALTDC